MSRGRRILDFVEGTVCLKEFNWRKANEGDQK